jgi:hypothetical protein
MKASKTLINTKKEERSDPVLKKYHNKVHDKPFEVSDRDSISIGVSAKGKNCIII